MSDVIKRFVDATFLDNNLGLVVDPTGLPEFDTAIHSREGVASELGPLVGNALQAQAELFGSTPLLNQARERHLAMVEASKERAATEHAIAYEATLRRSARGAALEQVASNELDASMQLRDTVTSMMGDMSQAYSVMDARLGVFDVEAAIAQIYDTPVNWSFLARGAINLYLRKDSPS
jgi:hypothetical protein